MTLADRAAKPANILILDIERLPGLARLWQPKTDYVHIGNWTRLPSLLCFAAKWYGERKTEFVSAWGEGGMDAMVKRAWELYDAADIVVTYNGIGFDNKHLRSEWLLAGMPPPSPWKDVDLYRVNRAQFGFESKSLNHLCHRLGLDTKDGHYDAVLAELCLEGDESARRKMKRYNVGDVKITEQAYDALRPWIHTHPHTVRQPGTCNVCGSSNLTPNGDHTPAIRDYPLFRCADCGANVIDRRSLGTRTTTRGVR